MGPPGLPGPPVRQHASPLFFFEFLVFIPYRRLHAVLAYPILAFCSLHSFDSFRRYINVPIAYTRLNSHRDIQVFEATKAIKANR